MLEVVMTTVPAHTVWKNVFRKKEHFFSLSEISDSHYPDFGPLSEDVSDHCAVHSDRPWSKAISAMESTWVDCVDAQDFHSAKKLFRVLSKIKLSDLK